MTDFNPLTDRIILDAGLWSDTLSSEQVVSRYAKDTGADTLLDFGGGNSLRLHGFDDLDLLADQIGFL